MSNTLSRLMLLFAELGIDTESGSYDKAEIVACAAGIDMIKNTIDASRKRIFDLWSDSLMPKEKYTMDNFDKRAKSVCKSYTIGKKNVLFEGVDYTAFSEFWHRWGYPFAAAVCSGTGMSWNKIEDTGCSWKMCDHIGLMWSMTDTMEVD